MPGWSNIDATFSWCSLWLNWIRKKQPSSWHHPSLIDDDVWTVQGRAAVAGKWQPQRDTYVQTRWQAMFKTAGLNHLCLIKLTIKSIIAVSLTQRWSQTPKSNPINLTGAIFFTSRHSWNIKCQLKHFINLLSYHIQNPGGINVVCKLTMLIPVLLTQAKLYYTSVTGLGVCSSNYHSIASACVVVCVVWVITGHATTALLNRDFSSSCVRVFYWKYIKIKTVLKMTSSVYHAWPLFRKTKGRLIIRHSRSTRQLFHLSKMWYISCYLFVQIQFIQPIYSIANTESKQEKQYDYFHIWMEY